jgi:HK97 family phage prohead protease
MQSFRIIERAGPPPRWGRKIADGCAIDLKYASAISSPPRTFRIVSKLSVPAAAREVIPAPSVPVRSNDYQNVRIKGYLSTFNGTDRDGDTVLPGAFAECIPRFMKNPVMLADHRNSVASVVGHFTVVREDRAGLYIEGILSNSPEVAHVRALVAEGHLKTMSMGGMFFYKEDGTTIRKVELYEGTLTPVPANPDAIFSV